VTELPLVTLRERDVLFRTGRPVTFAFIRNTAKSPYLGARFQQDIEPAGRYLLHDLAPTSLVRGWVRGKVSFRSPLVLRFSETGLYDETSWKAILTRRFRARGRALSRRLLEKGVDGIVTVENGETREIVDLTRVR